MTLCVFARDKLWQLYRDYPTLAFDLTWLAAREEQILDEHL
jgi:CRP/FNR family transcriptional regulator